MKLEGILKFDCCMVLKGIGQRIRYDPNLNFKP